MAAKHAHHASLPSCKLLEPVPACPHLLLRGSIHPSPPSFLPVPPFNPTQLNEYCRSIGIGHSTIQLVVNGCACPCAC